MKHTVATENAQSTQAIAAKLAKLLRGGEIIELSSDLGGGKTTFVQGLAAGVGYTGEVTSPTFVLSRVYNVPRGIEVHHYDLYRLGESGIVGDELAEDMESSDIVTVIEWAGLVEDLLPADRLQIEFVLTGDTKRDLEMISGGPVSEELLKGLSS